MNRIRLIHSPASHAVTCVGQLGNLPQKIAPAVILLPTCKGVVCLKRFLSEFNQ